MGRHRKLNYDELNGIVSTFRSQQQEVDTLFKQLKSSVESLHNNQWQGDAAEKWFSEMEGSLLPAVNKLSHALGFAADTTQKCMNVIRQADEGTKSFFAQLISGAMFK
jgi:WXG100 family type VII secretion target